MFGSGKRWWRGGEWIRGLCLSFTNPVGIGGMLDVCLCLVCSGEDGGESVGVWTRVWRGGVISV